MILVIAVAVLAAGCTGSGNAPAQPSGSSGSSGSGSSQQTAPGFSLTPTAVDNVPGYLKMTCDAEKDPINAKITVVSRGGDGLYMCKSLDVTAYLSTGEIFTNSMLPDVGRELKLDGTKGIDRIVVVANYDNGDSYKIYDDVLEYRKRTTNE
ncbi:MAG: hypothetical protein II893_06960 [Methanomicrobium sp.]|nr:hypothetical protein [Methanomicrobium sp.]